MIRQAVNRLDAYIDNLVGSYPATEKGLSLFRVLFALPVVFLSTGPRALWVTEYPDLFFLPPQPLSLLDCTGGIQLGLVCGFPSYWMVLALEIGFALAAVFLLFGYRTFYSSILFGVFLIALNTFRYSFGKIDHGDILLLVTPMILAFSGWGNHFSLDAKQGRKTEWSYPSYSLLFLALAIGVGFLSAGYPKALNWVDFDLSTSGVRRWVVNNYFVNGRTDWLAPVFAYMSNVWIWEVMDYSAVFFEIGIALSVLRGTLFKRFLGVAVAFHFANFLMLNISSISLLPVYAAFLPWGYALKTIGTSRLNKYTSYFSTKALLIISILGVSMKLLDLLSYIPHFGTIKTYLYFGTAICVVLGLAIREAKRAGSAALPLSGRTS